MAREVDISEEVKGVSRAILRAIAAGDPFGKAAMRVRETIVERTRRGVDRTGAAFAPYAESTIRRKGRSNVDLQESREMLEGILVRTGASGSSTLRKAEVTPSMRGRRLFRLHMEGRGRLPVRDAWGLTPAEELTIARETEVYIRRTVPTDRRRSITVDIFGL